jgi:hypothetical protein
MAGKTYNYYLKEKKREEEEEECKYLWKLHIIKQSNEQEKKR